MNPKLLLTCLILLLIYYEKVSSQKYDAEVIKYSTTCKIEKDNLIKTDSVTIKINNRVGDKYAVIEIPYSKNEKLSNVSGWIENMNGTKVRILKKSDMVDNSAISNISIYEDNFKRCFQLKHNIYPYKITYSYTTTYRDFITITEWDPVLHYAIPTHLATLKVILPKNYQFLKYERKIINCLKDSSDKNVELFWKSAYDKPFKNEVFSQSFNDEPLVIITPLIFNYGIKGLSHDWNSFGNWQYELLQGLDILPDDEKIKVKSLINGITDKREIIKILYHYLQDNTRYINVSIGIGGLKPYPASYVAHNKYGDCKALTNYMKALLQFAGIESYYTIVYAGEQPVDLIKELPCQQFNHVILAVPIENDTIWLENTSNINPFGFFGTFTQNRYALLVSKDNSHIVKIPALKKDDCLESEKMEFNLNTSGCATLKLNSAFKGWSFELFNELNYLLNGYDKNKSIQERIKFFHKIVPYDNFDIIDWNLKKQNRDSINIGLNSTITLNKFLNQLGNELYFNTTSIVIPDFTVPATRTLPVNLPYPIYNVDTLIYNVPNGYEVKTIPDNAIIKTQFGEFRTSYSSTGNKVLASKSFELYPGHYMQNEYPDFYKFIKTVKDTDAKGVVIKPDK